ncbi:MAG: hypothetical protein GMKNLPBB_01891 [Myxococcota bacterium]|nr:hypothetical protein [Myxococcota bacterium]
MKPSPPVPLRKDSSEHSILEETLHGVTHGMGFAFAIAALTLLVVLAALYGSARHVTGFSIFGGAMALTYLFSTLYHSLTHRPAKRIFRLLDHASIYLLIAGSYTPLLLLNLDNPANLLMLVSVWSLALIGMVLTLTIFERYKRISLIHYLVMGWLALFGWKELTDPLSTYATVMLIAGGGSYTAGALFYAWKKMPFNHAVWHVFVLGGSVCHFCVMLDCVPAAPV